VSEKQKDAEPTAWPAKVRTTQRPDLEVEVSEHEYNTLKLQGLLYQEGK
jgi:hypothetical protein